MPRHGFDVRGASDGRDALDQLASSPDLPSLILLDLLMPVLDGAGFRAAQSKDPRIAPIPVVVVSANSELRKTAERLGAAAHLAKPLSLEDLLRTVRAYAK